MEINRLFLLTFILGLINTIRAETETCNPVLDGEKLTISKPCEPGYYLLNDASNSIVKGDNVDTCTDGSNCKLRYCDKADGKTICKETEQTGNFLFALNNNGVLICKNGGCIYEEGMDGYYLSEMEDRFTKPLIKCEEDEDNDEIVICSAIASTTAGYYENSGVEIDDNINYYTNKNIFIKCDGKGNCEIVASAAKGYYSMLDTKEIIYKCDGLNCEEIYYEYETSDSCNDGTVIPGTLLSSSDGNIKYFCLKNSADQNDKVKFVDVSESYYIISNYFASGSVTDNIIFDKGAKITGPVNKNYLVKVGSNSVQAVKENGYYINSGNDKADNPIISYGNTKIESISKKDTFFKTSCTIPGSAAGTILKTGSDTSPSYTSFCPSHGATAVDFTGTTDAYMFLDLQTSSTVFGSEGDSVLVKYGNGKITVYAESGKNGYILNSGIDKDEKPLIQCDNVKCFKIEANDIPNGYYENVADDKSINPYIRCLGGSRGCEAVAIASLPTSCANAKKPELVQVFGKVKFCLSEDDSTSVDLSELTTDDSKYYLVNQNKNMKTVFNGEIADIANDNKILINIKKNSINLVNAYTGYYINSGDKDGLNPLIQCMKGICKTISNYGIVEDTSKNCRSTAGVLIYDSNERIYEFCPSKADGKAVELSNDIKYYYITVEKEENTIFTGLYDVGDKKGGVLVKTNKNSVELVTENGYYVTKDSKLVRCDEGNCNIVEPSENSYYINAGEGKPLIKYTITTDGTGTTKLYELVEAGGKYSYFINYGDSKTIIYCETKTSCTAITPQKGYYLNGDSADITNVAIKCDNKGCDVITSKIIGSVTISSELSETYHLLTIPYGNDSPFQVNSLTTAGQTKKILVKNGKNAMVMIESATVGYYVNVNNANGNDKLIYCKSNNVEDCSEVDASFNSYYINAGEDKNEKPIILCTKETKGEGVSLTNISNCSTNADSSLDVVTTECTPGKLFFDGTKIKNFCYGATTNKIDFTSAGNKYTILSIAAAETGRIFATTGTQQFIVESGDNKVTVQDATASKTTYYINSGSDAASKPLIQCTGANVCGGIQSGTGYYIHGITGDNSIINCNVGRTGCAVETAVEGFYLNGAGTANTNKIIEFKGSNVFNYVSETTDDTNCEPKKILRGSSDCQLCIDASTSNTLKLTETTEKYVFVNTNLLKVTGKKSVILVDTPGDYFDSTTPVPNIIRINTARKTRRLIGYYKNGSDMYGCTLSSCEKINTSTLSAECGASDASKIVNKSGLKLCKVASDTEPVVISGTDGYYKINNSIYKIGNNKAIEVGSYADGYFLDQDDNTLIYCETDGGTSTCKIITTPVVGYYYSSLGEATQFIKCVDDNGIIKCSYKLFTDTENETVAGCTNNVGKIKSDKKFCNDDNGMTVDNNNYFYNKYTVVTGTPFGEAEGDVILKIDKYSVTLVTPSSGYYLSSNVNEKLLFCESNDIGECNTIANNEIKNGYYIKADDNGKYIIKCKTSVPTLSCEEEALITSTCTAVSGILYSSGTYNYCVSSSSNSGMVPILTTSDYKYVILEKSKVNEKAAFYITENTPKEYLIKNSNKSFVIDTEGEENAFIVNDGADKVENPLIKVIGTAATREYDTVSNNNVSDGYYLNALSPTNENNLIICKNKVCKAEEVKVGYYVNSGDTTNKIIKCVSATKCTAIDVSSGNDIETGTSCTAAEKIIKNSFNFCIGSSGTGKSLSDSGEYYYLINNKLYKIGDKAAVVINSAGYYLNSGSTTSPIIKCNTSGSCEAISEGSISEKKCSDASTTLGGLIKESGKYYICIGKTDDERLEIKEESSQTYYPVEKIGNEVLGTTDTNIILRKGNKFINVVRNTDTEVEKYEKTSGGTTTTVFNIFISNTKAVSSGDDYKTCNPDGSITRYKLSDGKFTENKSCVKICDVTAGGCKEGYYIVDGSKKLITEEDKEGILYKCTSNSSCSLATDIPIGYIINAGNTGEEGVDVPYIVCSPTIDGIKCKTVEFSVSANDCSGKGIGAIFKGLTDSKKTLLCLGSEKAVELDTSNTTKERYVVKVEDNGIFGNYRILRYVTVSVVGGNATVDKVNTNENIPSYKYTDKYFKIYEITDENLNTSVCKATKDMDIYEFKFEMTDRNIGVNYYELNDYEKNTA